MQRAGRRGGMPMKVTTKKKRSGGKIAVLITAIVLVLAAGAGVLFNLYWNEWGVTVNLRGDETVTVECGDGYAEAGADAVYGGRWLFPERSSPEVTATGAVDTAVPGIYTVTYSTVGGAHGREHTGTAVRTVIVQDTTPPVIRLKWTEGHYTLPGQPYEEEGYSAADIADGDLTDRVQVREENGKVYYSVTDAAGNTASAEREIHYDDPIPPVLTLLGDETVTITAGTLFEDPGWTAEDNVDGDLTEAVVVSGTVERYHKGEYVLTYTVEDGYHNKVSATRTVVVKPIRQPDRVDPGSKIVYLTFDDGPGPYTAELLDVLAEHNVKATFFCVNTGYDSLIARETREGHSVGIHSATHNYSEIYASEEAFFADLEKMRGIIKNASGVDTTLMRFPGGSSNTVSSFNPGIMTRLTDAVTSMGYQYFDWNVLSGDAGETTSTEQVVKNVIDGISSHNVSIVLQHDIKGFSVAAVDEIITWGLSNGYTFLPLTPSSPTAHHGINN